MKAITIWQPWASLLACGAKQFETRGRATRYRGPIAIHAAKKTFDPLDFAVFDPPLAQAIQEALKVAGMSINYLPLGAIIATAKLIACHPIVSVGYTGCVGGRIAWVDGELNPHYPAAHEIMFGDWTSGRYAWEITNVRMLPEPIPAKGQQGFWNWNDVIA